MEDAQKLVKMPRVHAVRSIGPLPHLYGVGGLYKKMGPIVWWERGGLGEVKLDDGADAPIPLPG